MAKKCKPVRVAVIGCSSAAEGHIAALIAAPETKLVACCDINKERVKEFRKKYKIRRGYTNYLKLLRRPLLRRRIQAVHICLPSASRAAIAGYCLLKKCHVMIEPPMALDLAVAEEAVKNAGYMGKSCGVLLPARANATTAYVREALGAGRLGKILSVKSVICATPLVAEDGYDGTFADKTAGRLLFDFASHTIDLVDTLIADDIAELSCSMANRAHTGEGAADSAEGVITYSGDVKHSFYCTRNYENGGSSQISLLCEGGELVCDASDVRITYADGTTDGMHDDNPAMGCLDQIREFYTACREGTVPSNDARTALRLHEILIALYEDAIISGLYEKEKAATAAKTAKKKRLWY